MKRSTVIFSDVFLGVGLVLTLIVLFTVTVPLERILLVFLHYGTRGYFHDGIRVLTWHPPRFSNGEPIPSALGGLIWGGSRNEKNTPKE
jgi:hypothetical protein